VKLPKLHRLTFLTGFLLGTALLLAACGGVAQESAAEPEVEQPVAQQQEIAEEPTATSAPTDTPEPATPTNEPATATSQPAEEPAEEEVAEEETETEPTSPPAKPTPRQGFAATPPEEVQLASGQVQLVEFYATW
jgi:hypothetical protein